MSHHFRNAVAFSRAQASYDAMTPPDDDGLTPCSVCDGDGHRMVLSDDNKPYREVCPACEGARWLDETGYPYTQQESEE